MISRLITNDLIETLNYFPVLGLIGPRQVGKTTLSKQLVKQLNKDFIYLDLESTEDLAKLTDPVLFLKKNTDKCLILDEVQRMPEIFPILRSLIDMDRKPARFILTGSASPDLIRDLSESLAGRIAYTELTPFNILEVNEIQTIDNHWLRGGFPEAMLAPSQNISIKWLNNFIKTYIEKDLPLLGLQVSPTMIRNLWSMLAHIHGNVLNMELLAKSLEITSPTVKKYIWFLSDAFLLRILEPFHTNIKKRLVKSPKVFIRDTGILHALLGITKILDLDGHPIKGNSWEGYIIEQIYLHCNEKYGMYFYRTHQGAECDLVLTIANKPVAAIEIKYTAAPKLTKGLQNSIEDLNTSKNFIICATDDDYPLAENIIVCNILSFLKNHLPILF